VLKSGPVQVTCALLTMPLVLLQAGVLLVGVLPMLFVGVLLEVMVVLLHLIRIV
jgi:hypothetical protein